MSTPQVNRTTPLEMLPAPVALRVTWSEEGGPLTPLPTNLSAIQLSHEGLILSFGFGAPPLLSGPAEEQQEKMAATTELVVAPHTKLLFSPDKLRELIGMLEQALVAMDAVDQRLAVEGDDSAQ